MFYNNGNHGSTLVVNQYLIITCDSEWWLTTGLYWSMMLNNLTVIHDGLNSQLINDSESWPMKVNDA